MTKLAASNPGRHEAATYEIRVQGHLDARWAAQLDVAGLVHDPDGTTVLHVVAADQSALHGLLQQNSRPRMAAGLGHPAAHPGSGTACQPSHLIPNKRTLT